MQSPPKSSNLSAKSSNEHNQKNLVIPRSLASALESSGDVAGEHAVPPIEGPLSDIASEIAVPPMEGPLSDVASEFAVPSIEGPLSDITQRLADVALTSEVVKSVKASHQELMKQHKLVPKYKAKLPGILVEPTSDKRLLAKVLLVFLGPSSHTRASLTGEFEWNPFLMPNGEFTPSVKLLHNELHNTTSLDLKDFYLTDAFPLLYWDGRNSPTAQDYEAHFNYGVDHVRHIIKVLKPDFVLSLGNQSAWVVEKVFNDKLRVIRSNFSTNGNYTHSYGYIDKVDDISVYYCKHPNCRSRDKYDHIKTAINDIVARTPVIQINT